jgi:hypothetical protein
MPSTLRDDLRIEAKLVRFCRIGWESKRISCGMVSMTHQAINNHQSGALTYAHCAGLPNSYTQKCYDQITDHRGMPTSQTEIVRSLQWTITFCKYWHWHNTGQVLIWKEMAEKWIDWSSMLTQHAQWESLFVANSLVKTSNFQRESRRWTFGRDPTWWEKSLHSYGLSSNRSFCEARWWHSGQLSVSELKATVMTYSLGLLTNINLCFV